MGSATTVASRDKRLQSVGVVVKHHAPTDACLTSRQNQDKIDSEKINKKDSFNLYRVPQVIYKVFYLMSLSLLAVLEISCRLARDKLTERKSMKMRGEKTKELQSGSWDNERFDRE